MEIKESKICSICSQEKPITDYYKLNKKFYHARCKVCFKVKQYEYYDNTKEVIKLKRLVGYYTIRKQIKDNEGSSNFND
jgi:hypothetical protein